MLVTTLPQHTLSIRHPSHDASPHSPKRQEAIRLLELLLGPELVGVAALLLAAVDGTRGEAGVALAADPARELA
jgi:hypothetical protein